MPLAYWIVPHSDLVLVLGHGVVAETDVSAFSSALRKDPRFRPTQRALVDHRAVSRLDLDWPALERVRDGNPFALATPRVVVAPSDGVYGVLKMYERVLGPEQGPAFHLFRDWDDGLEWLGVEDSALPDGPPDWQEDRPSREEPRVKGPLLAWLRLDRAHEPRYQGLEIRTYAAEEAEDPTRLWLHVKGERLYVERADFEVRTVRP